jgi:hypothetical protein
MERHGSTAHQRGINIQVLWDPEQRRMAIWWEGEARTLARFPWNIGESIHTDRLARIYPETQCNVPEESKMK